MKKQKKIGVLRYGIGNINSFTNTLDKLDISYKIIDDPSDLKKIDIIILLMINLWKYPIRNNVFVAYYSLTWVNICDY